MLKQKKMTELTVRHTCRKDFIKQKSYEKERKTYCTRQKVGRK